jgi:hypothetical protein
MLLEAMEIKATDLGTTSLNCQSISISRVSASRLNETYCILKLHSFRYTLNCNYKTQIPHQTTKQTIFPEKYCVKFSCTLWSKGASIRHLNK